MNLATIAIMAIFTIYTAISWIVVGPLDSISESWYRWKDKDFSPAFNIFGAAAFLACAAQWFYGYEHLTKLFFTLSGACMWLLTVASPYKQYNTYHIVPTFSAIGLGYAAVWAQFGLSWVFCCSLGAGVVGSLLLHFAPHRTTWRELWVVTCILTPFIWASGNTL